MIGTEKIEEIIELTILSGHLKYERPLSLLIIANAESGKTELMKKFLTTDGITYLTDCTAHGITKEILPKIESSMVHHLMIPDLLKPLSRRESTVKGLISFLNALIEEGIADISTYAQGMTYRKEHLRCGLIAAITREALADKRHQWTSMGFLTRAIPFSYKYASPKIADIFQYIITGKYHDEDCQKLKEPKGLKEIAISKAQATKFLPYTYQFAQANKIYGFRFQRCLQVLAQANALKNKRTSVNNTDIKKIISFMEWINLDFNNL